MRLDKFICKCTVLSKEEAIEQISKGSVTINNVIATEPSKQVHKNNQTQLSGQTLSPRPFKYILIHKPLNTICSNHDEAYSSILNVLPKDKLSELHLAGRLDANTTGLVLATDNGHWSFNITRPEKQCKKVYRVGLSRPISDDATLKITTGIKLQGEQQLTLPATLNINSSHEVLLTITEGRFHQVKRMFAAVGNRVVSLHREQIGDICLDVNVGQWRNLTKAEVHSFNN